MAQQIHDLVRALPHPSWRSLFDALRLDPPPFWVDPCHLRPLNASRGKLIARTVPLANLERMLECLRRIVAPKV